MGSINYGKDFHGYEKYTHNVENLINNYCKKYSYKFGIWKHDYGYKKDGGTEICYSIVDGCKVITEVSYLTKSNDWRVDDFCFKLDLTNVKGLTLPEIHYSNQHPKNGKRYSDQFAMQKLRERFKTHDKYRELLAQVNEIENKIKKMSAVLCTALDREKYGDLDAWST